MTNEELQTKYIGKWVKCIKACHVQLNQWAQITHLSVVDDGDIVAKVNGVQIGCCPRKLESNYFDCDNLMDYNPNEKIELKVGDIVSKSEEFCNDGDLAVRIFLDEYEFCTHGTTGSRDLRSSLQWYVNGVKYESANIVIPSTAYQQCASIGDSALHADSCCAERDNLTVDNQKGVNHIADDNNKVEFEEITKENIVSVLQYNNINESSYEIYNDDDAGIGYQSDSTWYRFDFGNKNWLQHLELETGKLKPLPKQLNNLLTWYNNHKVESIWLDSNQDYYLIKHNSNTLIARIPKSWALEKQTDFLKSILSYYTE